MQCHIFVSLVTPRFLKRKAPNFLDFVMTLVNLGARLFLEKYQHFYTAKTSYNTNIAYNAYIIFLSL